MANNIPVGNVCQDGLLCRGNQCISQPCSDNAQCDGAAPFCIEGLCAEACTDDTQCPGSGHGAELAYCEAGSCVACRTSVDCPAAAPICDSNVCKGCNADSDCASGVCDVDQAACVDESTILYITGSGSDTATCTKSDPCSLSHAFTLVSPTRNLVKLGQGVHIGEVVAVGPLSVTIVGPGTIASAIGVLDGGTLKLRDLTVNNSVGCGISSANQPIGTLDLERVNVNTQGGMQCELCDVTIRNSTIRSTSSVATTLINVGGEIAGIGGALATRSVTLDVDSSHIDGGDPAVQLYRLANTKITNSVFVNQGTGSGWFDLSGGGTSSTVQFSTFLKGGLKCTGNGFIAFSNNIFVNAGAGIPADTTTGSQCSHSFDLITPQATAVPGNGNLTGNIDPQWVGASAGDFHLRSTSPAVNVADPSSTVTTDYDGIARPQGGRSDMGAFEYKP